MRTRDAAVLLVAFAAHLVPGCGGSRFSAGDSGGAGQGGGAGTGQTGGSGDEGGAGGSTAATSGSGADAGRGGTGGDSGAGGTSGGGGSAGKGGSAGSAGCNCTPVQYCRSGTCRNCSDLSSIQLDTPEEVLDHPSSGLRFPRVGDSRDSLFFTLLAPSRSELWYVDDPTASGSITLGDAQTPSRSGLFYTESATLAFNVLFDQLVNGARVIGTATFSGTTLTNLQPGGAPFGMGGFDDYSVALAAETNRAYFMSTRDGVPSLRTGVLGTDEATVVDLAIPARSGGVSCPLSGDDATPWVTADGSLLVFRAEPMDAACQPLDGAATDLYAVALQPSSGMPVTPAVALSGVNVTGSESSESDPSFSPDLCTMYFASDGGSVTGFDFRLFRASRR